MSPTDLGRTFGLTRMAACLVTVPIGLIVPSRIRPQALAVAALAYAVCLDLDTLPGLALTGAIVYLVVLGLGRIGDLRARWSITLGLIALVLAVFFVGRAAGLDKLRVAIGPRHFGFFVLDMWLLLRVVTLLWEVGSGKTPLLSPLAFIGWLALPFTMGGPLLRASAYASSLERSELPRLDSAWVRRVAIACAMVAAAFALEFYKIPHDQQPRWLRVVMLFFVPWSFYLWAAGFSSLMSATSAAWGLSIPESFVRPFTRRNLAEFWANWNITATEVFRDYLFYARWGRKGRPNLYLNACVIFVLVGAWHDTGPFYLLWGVYHALGYVVFMWYRANKASLAPLWPRVPERVATLASVAATYVFVCLSWTLPLFAIEAFKHLAHRIHG
jgi:D-alanyl-lipoteichoic acid acyltransferase DltB (MBOAT superfamily)